MPLFNSQAPKKPANLSVNTELLKLAKELGINLSATLEQALAEQVKAKRREQWLLANQDAIQRYNEVVEDQGVFSDGLREF